MTVTADLAEQLAALRIWLPWAHMLARHPDVDGTVGHAQPASRIPGNQQAFDVHTTITEGLARLEASMRLSAGLTAGPRRGGAYECTLTALKAIENLSPAVTTRDHAQAARILAWWVRQIQALKAVDLYEAARRYEGAECPYCHYGMLIVRPREGRVACPRYSAGECCGDGNGQQPVGFVDTSRLNGSAVIRWQDGLVT